MELQLRLGTDAASCPGGGAGAPRVGGVQGCRYRWLMGIGELAAARAAPECAHLHSADSISQGGLLFSSENLSVWGTSAPLLPTPAILSPLYPRVFVPSWGDLGSCRAFLWGSGHGCSRGSVLLRDKRIASGAGRRLSPARGACLALCTCFDVTPG